MSRYYVAEIECKKFWNCLINANLISSQEFRLAFFRAPSYKIPLTASPLIFNQFKARTLELKTIFGCVNFFSSKATLIFKNDFFSSVQTKKQFKAVRPDAIKLSYLNNSLKPRPKGPKMPIFFTIKNTSKDILGFLQEWFYMWVHVCQKFLLGNETFQNLNGCH